MMKQSQVVLLVAAVTALQPVARLQRAPVRMAASDVLASDRILIAPALATSNVAKLGEEAQAAVAAGADCLHFNVMDGTSSAEINQCVRPIFWQPRCSTRVLGVLAQGVFGLFTRTFDFRTGELWFRFGVIVDIIGGKLKEDKAGKNSNPDVNVTLRAFDPPLRYPLNESDLLCLCINQYHSAHCLVCAQVTSRTSSESLVRRTIPLRRWKI